MVRRCSAAGRVDQLFRSTPRLERVFASQRGDDRGKEEELLQPQIFGTTERQLVNSRRELINGPNSGLDSSLELSELPLCRRTNLRFASLLFESAQSSAA